MNNLERLYPKIAPEHCFDITLGDFEQIISNDFMKLEAR